MSAGPLEAHASHPEYAHLHAAYERIGRFHDVAAAIVQDALEAARADPLEA